MFPKLVALTAMAWGTSSFVGAVPALDLVAAIFVPCMAIGWVVYYGLRAAGMAWLGGLGCVALLAPDRLAEFGTSGIAGAILGESIRRDSPIERSFFLALVPFALGTLAMALSGASPALGELRGTLERIFEETARRGDLSVEGIAQLRSGADRALEFFGKTWVGVEIAEFGLLLLVSWAVACRLFRDRLAGGGSFGRLDLPDELAWGFALGLALYLGGTTWFPSDVSTVGLNLLVVTGMAYAIRGTAVLWHWMGRSQVSPAIRVGLLMAAWIFFLPFHGMVTGGLGLFDTWFDFRRLKADGEREDPLRVFHQSSGDDS